MSADDKRPSRTLGGLASRRSMPPDPSTSRLHRELRAVPEVASAITQPLKPASEPGEAMQQPTTEPAAAETTSAMTNTASPTGALPRYLQLIRKESQLRQDQPISSHGRCGVSIRAGKDDMVRWGSGSPTTPSSA